MSDAPALYAIVAEFNQADTLLDAVKQAKEAGFSRIEAFSPFPVKGMEKALGFSDPVLAPAMLIGALGGFLGGFFLQVYTNLDFPLNVGGRPLIASPAFILISVELLFLGAVSAIIVAMLLRNRLPRLHHPMFEIPAFHFATDDKFFLAVLADDPAFDRARDFLDDLHPVAVSEAPMTEPPE